MTCARDCFNCPYPDCINDELDEAEFVASEAFDRLAMLLQGIDVIAVERHRMAARERYQANRESILDKQRQYSREHPEKRREANQKHYQKIKTERKMRSEDEKG